MSAEKGQKVLFETQTVIIWTQQKIMPSELFP